MEEIKHKLRKWIDKRWNYELQCDVFEELDIGELGKIASMYGIDSSLSRVQICNKLAQILEQKKKEYKVILEKSACSNTMDPISGTDVDDIDPRNLITLEQSGQLYCFELDGIYNYIKKNNKKNPYTNVQFEESHFSQIEKEYAAYSTLKGKKFDEDAYASETSLTALVSQLSSFLPYTTGIDKFINADLEEVEQFLDRLQEAYVDIDVKPTELKQYKIQIVQKLIKWILENDYENVRQAWIIHQSYTNIYNAIKTENLDALKELIENENEDIDGLMVLAARYNKLNVVKYLIELGADIHAGDDYALKVSATNGNLELVKFLVENGADIHAENETTLINSILNENLDIVKFLIENGAVIDGNDSLSVSIVTGNLDVFKYIISIGADKIDALKTSADYGQLDFIKYLQSIGTNISAEDDYALKISAANGHLDVVKFLVENGANIHADYETALISSASNGHLGIVKFLVENGADVHAEDNAAIVIARMNRHSDVVDYLKNA